MPDKPGSEHLQLQARLEAFEDLKAEIEPWLMEERDASAREALANVLFHLERKSPNSAAAWRNSGRRVEHDGFGRSFSRAGQSCSQEQCAPAQHVAEAIAGEASRWSAVLVVLGTHGRRGFQRLSPVAWLSPGRLLLVP